MPATDQYFSHYVNEIKKRVHALLIIIDDSGKVIMPIARSDLVIGFQPEELQDMSIRMFIRPDCIDRFEGAFDAMRAGGNDPRKLELKFLTKDGKSICLSVMMYPVQGPNGERQFCLHGQDITAYKDDQWTIEMMNKKLNILGSATRHDVLNSLTGLFGYLELAEVKCKEENVIRYIAKAKISAETVQKQIEFTRAYQELGSKKPNWIKIKDVIRSAYCNLDEPRIPLEVDVDDLEVFADPMMEKVFFNIMDNARRHAQARSMHITFTVKGATGQLVISDDGKGVTKDEKEYIFKRGYGRNTGFGLYLSREILEITGIKIVEEGEEGKGARFVITIPQKRFRTKV
jgi:PAS domain S-box-containing protein